MSYVYVDKKMVELHNEYFDLFNSEKTIFDSMEIQTKVEIAIRWIWQGLESLPPELIPRIDWFLNVPTKTPTSDRGPPAKKYEVKSLLVKLEFESEVAAIDVRFRIYADGEIAIKIDYPDENDKYPMFDLLNVNYIIREKEWTSFYNYLMDELNVHNHPLKGWAP